MTLSTACPKPSKRTESAKRVDQLVKAWSRKDRWRQNAIAKAKGKPRTQVKKRNDARIKRKHAAYRKVIASAFHKELRYLAYKRSGGRCECDECVEQRKGKETGIGERYRDAWARYDMAWARIPCWFVNGSGAPSKRFRSTEGELHHLTYKFFSEQNPEELQHVRWVHTECHRRIESLHGTRRRYLAGR